MDVNTLSKHKSFLSDSQGSIIKKGIKDLPNLPGVRSMAKSNSIIPAELTPGATI